ncbi:hypothetical protein B0H11DRAFT_1736610, partial [Mycena galericulata]
QTQFEKLREEKTTAGRAPWEPFESEDERQLARWLVTSGTSQTKVDEFLKLKKVRTTFPRALLQRIDALPQGNVEGSVASDLSLKRILASNHSISLLHNNKLQH